MKPLASDEKIAMVMVYTHNTLIRGEVVIKEALRVSIWLRTQGIPNFIHLHNPQVILFGGTPPKTLTYVEMFVPTVDVLGFHIAPPEHDPMDYDPKEVNRIMQPVDMMVGTFLLKGQMRMSSLTDVATNLDVSRTAWMSIYEADIINPYLHQFNLHVPMLLVNPLHVTFGIQ